MLIQNSFLSFIGIVVFTISSMVFASSRHFIIDTDMAIDDAIAIIYFTRAPGVSVDAITIAGTGEAHCKPALQNLIGLLKVNHLDNKIPVACGPELPLSGKNHFANDVRLSADMLGHKLDLLKHTFYVSKYQAITLLEQTLQNSKTPLNILTLGPLTNIALLISEHPELKTKIHRIYIMGGAVHVAGNLFLDGDKNKLAEWNIYVDSKAANIVFTSGVPITLIPLDVTNQVPIEYSFYQSLQQQHFKPAANYVYQIFARNPDMLHGWYFWDPLAAVIAAHPDIAQTKHEKLRVLLKPENKSGGIIVDENRGNNIDVCYSVDKLNFKSSLLATLNS